MRISGSAVPVPVSDDVRMRVSGSFDGTESVADLAPIVVGSNVTLTLIHVSRCRLATWFMSRLFTNREIHNHLTLILLSRRLHFQPCVFVNYCRGLEVSS